MDRKYIIPMVLTVLVVLIASGLSQRGETNDSCANYLPMGSVQTNETIAYMDSPWPMFRHDPSHSGLSQYSTEKNNGKLLWRSEVCSNENIEIVVLSSPVIDNSDKIYIGSYDGYFYALSSEGTSLWYYMTANEICSSPALADNGTIYYGSCDHYIYALNPNGLLKWRQVTDKMILSSPVISDNGTIYFGSQAGGLYSLNPDGTINWRALPDEKQSVFSSPAIGPDGTIYFGTSSWGNNFHAVYPNGTIKWSFKADQCVLSSPCVDGTNTVYVGSNGGQFYAINANGSLKWSLDIGYAESSPGIGPDGTIYIGSLDYQFYAINPSGTIEWTYRTVGAIKSSPAIDKDGIIYITDVKGYLYSITSDGSLRWRFKADIYPRIGCLSSPAIGADGTVYFSSNAGYLYAIGYKEGGPEDQGWNPLPGFELGLVFVAILVLVVRRSKRSR